jgi:hypothetical protein
VPISPTFYAWLYCAKVLGKAFCTYILGLKFFGKKKYWRKCTHKILVKLTTGLTNNNNISKFDRQIDVIDGPIIRHIECVTHLNLNGDGELGGKI